MILLLFLSLANAKTYTAVDILDVRCEERCVQRDYMGGFANPRGGCVCFDTIASPEINRTPIKLPANLRGKAIYPGHLITVEF